MNWRRPKRKLSKFILRHPILSAIAANKITAWLDTGYAAIRDFLSSQTRPSASAPIPPSASAPIPPPKTVKAGSLIWPIEDQNAKIYFARRGAIFYKNFADNAALLVAGSGTIQNVEEHKVPLYVPMFRIEVRHDNGFHTFYTGYGAPIIGAGRVTQGDTLAYSRYPCFVFQLVVGGRLVDPCPYLPALNGATALPAPHVVDLGMAGLSLMDFAFGQGEQHHQHRRQVR